MRGYQFPVTVSKDWYVTKVGGHTADLSPGEVGINVSALRQNTSLEEGDVVSLRPFEDSPHPFFRRPEYRVVPLGEESEDGFRLSVNGEAALPLEESGLMAEEEIIINSTDLPDSVRSAF